MLHSQALLVAVAVVTSRVFFLILVAAYQATTHYAGTGANEGAFTAAQQPTNYGTTGTAYCCTLSLTAPALRLILGLGSRAYEHKKQQ